MGVQVASILVQKAGSLYETGLEAEALSIARSSQQSKEMVRHTKQKEGHYSGKLSKQRESQVAPHRSSIQPL